MNNMENEIKPFLDRLSLSLEFDDSIEVNSLEELIDKGNTALEAIERMYKTE